MKRPAAHGKLLGLLWLALPLSASLAMLAGCGGLLPDRQARNAMFQTYGQVMEAYNEIVPGMTNAQDLPALGFDTKAAHVDVLSHRGIEARFLRAAGGNRQNLAPAVKACIRAGVYCTGFVFHPGDAPGKRPGVMEANLFGFTRSSHWSADVTLLVMNGRVAHKVFSRTGRAALSY